MPSTFGSSKNTHLEHPEDLVILHADGVSIVKKIFAQIVQHILDYGQTPAGLTIKYDGAPAVFYGRDPESGRFFISTKSVFATNAKKALRKSDIKHLWNGPLAQKLLYARPHLKKYTGSAIIQGDLLFVRDVGDVQERVIDNENWVTRRPNTLVYATQSGTPEAQRVQSSSIGLINHTLYRPDHSGRPVVVDKMPKQLNSGAVWTPALYPTISEEYDQGNCTQLLEAINALDDTVSGQGEIFLQTVDQRAKRQFVLPGGTIEKNEHDTQTKKKKKEPSKVTPMILPLRESYMRYTNLIIRKGTVFQSSEQRFTDFTRRYLDEYASKIAKLQRERDIFRYELGRRAMDVFFKRRGDRTFGIVETQQKIVHIKETIIDLLETARVPDVNCFLPQGSTYIPTGHEGYVMRSQQGAIKLVKRAVFSRANFIEPKLWGKNSTEGEKQHSGLLFFARMNPPTKQHIAFLRTMMKIAKESGAPYYFFLSHTQDNNNPLPQALKIKIIQAAIPELNIIACGDEVKTLYDAVRFVNDQGCTHLGILGGADREEVIEELQEKKQDYGIQEITGIRLGDREFGQDVANEKHISGTMTRQFAREGNFEQFSRCFDEQVPESLIKEAYESICNGQ